MLLGLILLVACVLFLIVAITRQRRSSLLPRLKARPSLKILIESVPLKNSRLYLGIYLNIDNRPEYRGIFELTELFLFDFHSGFDPRSGIRAHCDPPEPLTLRSTVYLECQGWIAEKVERPEFVSIYVGETHDDPGSLTFVGKGVIAVTRELAESKAKDSYNYHNPPAGTPQP